MSYIKGNETKWVALAIGGATLSDFKNNPENIEWVCGCPEELNTMFTKQTDTRNPICKPGSINVVTGIDGSASMTGAFDTESPFDVYLLENECTLEKLLIITVDTVLSGNGKTEPMVKEPIVHIFEGVPETEFTVAGGETREYTLDINNADYICNISQDYIPECILQSIELSPFVTASKTLEVPIGATVDEAYLIANADLKYSGFGLGVEPTFSVDPTPIDTVTPGTATYTITYTDGLVSASTTIEIIVL